MKNNFKWYVGGTVLEGEAAIRHLIHLYGELDSTREYVIDTLENIITELKRISDSKNIYDGVMEWGERLSIASIQLELLIATIEERMNTNE